MTIERTDTEVIIRVSSAIDKDDLQQAIDYLQQVETTSSSTIKTDTDQFDFDKECASGMSVEKFHQRLLTHIDGLPWKE